MARVSREQAEKHRQRIVTAAAKLFRERGLNGVSIAETMAEAGLTHGGFYGHFASKDALAAEACALAFLESRQRWQKKIALCDGKDGWRKALEEIVDSYLDTGNRDGSGPRCAAAALVRDVDREPADKPVHRSYAEGINGLIEKLAELYADNVTDGRQQALASFSTMVGALTLARATRGEPVSDEILQAARERLLGGVNWPHEKGS